MAGIGFAAFTTSLIFIGCRYKVDLFASLAFLKKHRIGLQRIPSFQDSRTIVCIIDIKDPVSDFQFEQANERG